ncbi:2-oxoacid:acceptor oxidoreductase subunit alpha [bacterium]|nr:2-oxoacid:acceptor oxidoreductase subunit alpha [bacterium]
MSVKTTETGEKPIQSIQRATVRFAGDSGDGMQLSGMQFTNTSAVYGNDVSTLPDFPAEIRAPAGTVYGVSGFQLHFSSEDIHTPGDQVDTLVAMNPAALKVNLRDLKPGGIIVANEDGFTTQNLKLAGFEESPLDDGSLDGYRVFQVPMTNATTHAVEELGVTGRDAHRCKNFFALGLVCWLYSRPLDPVVEFIHSKFKSNEQMREANLKVLHSGYYFGETAEMFQNNFQVKPATLPKGLYRQVRGNEALALGLLTAGHLAKKELFYGGYPITPASDILHELARHKEFGVRTVQAEDEIAGICTTIGAAFGGSLGVTASSGPGIALKGEALGLATILELPLIVVNVQRGGPSTGLPTKTEQSDLMQAMYGRNGDCPMPVLAPRSPSDCFDIAIQAVRIALKYMTPVMILSDGYIANSAEPWLVPSVDDLEEIPVHHLEETNGPDGELLPYKRDEDYSRPWVLPGTPGLMHRVGGLEKADGTGNVSYDPDNHQRMTDYRHAKVEKVVDVVPDQIVYGDPDADVLLIGWGGTYGAIREATAELIERGHPVANIHLRYLNPFPKNLPEILKKYKHVLVAELNKGQLREILRARFLVDARGLNKVQGRPFMVSEIVTAVEMLMNEEAK